MIQTNTQQSIQTIFINIMKVTIYYCKRNSILFTLSIKKYAVKPGEVTFHTVKSLETNKLIIKKIIIKSKAY